MLVRRLSIKNISSIVAVISPFEKTDQYVEKNSEYFEIYLESSLDERIKRDKNFVTALNGEKKYVIDDIPFDKPKNSDLVINTENQSPADVANKILKKIRL